MKFKHYIFLIFAGLMVISCENKLDLTDIVKDSKDKQITNISDTVYIQQSPIWTGFNKPEDIIVGREPFIYVADTQNDRIVMLDVSGKVLGSKAIKHPIAIAQDYRLNLIVCAQFDTTINSNQVTFSAVYKIDLVDAGHILNSAEVTRVLPQNPNDDPFAFTRPDRQYTGVTVFFDNSIYVSRKGPKNSNPIDRDNAILTLKYIQSSNSPAGVKDSLIVGKVPLLEAEGTGMMSANKISSLTSFNRKSLDIILTLIGDNSFKVQWLQFVVNPDFSGYQPKLPAFSSDMMQVNKFGKPEDTALDNAGNIFVADAQKDSIFKFNSFGDELQSFGGSDLLNEPHAVAFFDKILYVLDTGNDRIVRFILSTDTQ